MAKMQKKKLKYPEGKFLTESGPIYKTSMPNSIEELEPLSVYSILVALLKFDVISITDFYLLGSKLHPELSKKLVELSNKLGTFSLKSYGLDENGRELFKVKLNDAIANEQKFQSVW